MRARAVNQHYLGQNTLRDLDAEYAAGGAANQSHAPRAAKAGGLSFWVALVAAQNPRVRGPDSDDGFSHRLPTRILWHTRHVPR